MWLIADVTTTAEDITGSGIARLGALLTGMGTLTWFILRNVVKYQQYFTNFYMTENVKLRNDLKELRDEFDALRDKSQTEIDDLRKRLNDKDDEIRSLRFTNQTLQAEVDRLKEKLRNAGLS